MSGNNKLPDAKTYNEAQPNNASSTNNHEINNHNNNSNLRKISCSNWALTEISLEQV